MRNKALAILAALLMAGSVEGASAIDDFKFSKQYSYVDESKILHLLGEVTNNSTGSVEGILVNASFYDAAGNPLGEFRRSAELRSLAPGESSPFEILFLDQNASANVSNFMLSATGTETVTSREKRLEVVSANSRLDVLGTFYLNAAARNRGDQTSTNTIMIATLYDKDSRVVAIGRAQAEAVSGTADVPANSNSPFGFAITDRLQTYKIVRYSLVVQSDQYASEAVLFGAPGQGSPTGNQTQSGCLIATAAFGSEFAPQVQQLREFRDEIAMETFAGSSFMAAFNSWYYSFSPSVAEYERHSPPAREAVRVLIQPLLLILSASASLHGLLTSSGLNAEAAVVGTGMTASSLVGLLYLFPAAVAVGIKKKRILGSSAVKTVLISCWALSCALVVTGLVWPNVEAMGIATSALVLCCMTTAMLFLSDRLSRL